MSLVCGNIRALTAQGVAMQFPEGKTFAFSILDDTDDATLSNVKPVYDFLRELGFRTTKTVWPMDCPEGSRRFFAAETLQDKPYLEFVHNLVDQGFELALHGATMESSLRERTIRGLNFIKQEFGKYPRLFCNHGYNRENLYWGSDRFGSVLLGALSRLRSCNSQGLYEGASEESPFFWGDLCKAHIQYVRNFTFSSLDIMNVNPEMPYRLTRTPYVNYWFSTAEAADVRAFNRLLTRDEIDRLEGTGGVCIISTHFGKGFANNGKLHDQTAQMLRYLGTKDGWFVPVSDILDHLKAQRGQDAELGWLQQRSLEYRFIFDKLRMLA
jgi:hypothetical protein